MSLTFLYLTALIYFLSHACYTSLFSVVISSAKVRGVHKVRTCKVEIYEGLVIDTQNSTNLIRRVLYNVNRT
jgi:hypothetical protein